MSLDQQVLGAFRGLSGFCMWPINSPEERARFGTTFRAHLARYYPRARYVTCTLPGYYMLVGFIFATIPGARVIHCTRDSLDQCVEM